jgi:hypothetical protein
MHLAAPIIATYMVVQALAAPASQYVLVPLEAISSWIAPTHLGHTNPASAISSEANDLPPPIRTPNTSDVPSGSESTSTAANTTLISMLELAATAVDRAKLLNDNSDHIFDFAQPPPNANSTTISDGGRTVKADRKTFPALVGTGVSMTVGYLGACGFNTPHTHPRSAEMNIVVEGRLIAEYVAENGASIVRNVINTHQATVFPQGALHTEMNPDCFPATFVAGFASEDPGVQQTAQSLFDLDDDLLEAAFNSDFTFAGQDIDQFRALIPKNVALGVDSCLEKCGLRKSSM